MESESARDSYQALEEAFLTIPGVEAVGASSQIPGQGFTSNGYFPEGSAEPMMIHALDVDYQYLKTMGLEFVRGRNFSTSYGQDESSYIINETLAKKLGWEDPIGKIIQRSGEHKIIGMVKDFHFSPLHSRIQPLIITLQPWQGYSYLTLRHSGDLTTQLKKNIEQQWSEIIPYESFSFFTLTSFMKEAYHSEKTTLNILIYCSGLAVLIAAIGLLAMAALLTRHRYREIAVRKVFGAYVSDIIGMVSAGFIKWVLIANLIAWPIAYFMMDRYLQNFAFNAGLKWWIFLVALIFTALLSFLVILYQVLRLSRLNPVDYIRYE